MQVKSIFYFGETDFIIIKIKNKYFNYDNAFNNENYNEVKMNYGYKLNLLSINKRNVYEHYVI